MKAAWPLNEGAGWLPGRRRIGSRQARLELPLVDPQAAHELRLVATDILDEPLGVSQWIETWSGSAPLLGRGRGGSPKEAPWSPMYQARQSAP